MNNNLIEFKNVSLHYFSDNGVTIALEDLSFKINNFDFIAIVGPSGCGKTTILSLIAKLIEPTEGEIKYKQDIDYIGYMFQKDQLLEWRTIYKNIILGLEIQHKLNKENIEYINSLLKKYDLWEFRNKYPSQLSGGMRQRVALIRTLALKPKILLLDEAFSALDYQTRLEVVDSVYKIIQQEKVTAILVTHDIMEAITLANKIFILSKRPAKIKKIIDVEYNKKLTPLEKRKENITSKYFDEIWEMLQ